MSAGLPIGAVALSGRRVRTGDTQVWPSAAAHHLTPRHEYGLLRADLERQGQPVGANDLMIAAIARRNDLTVVTHNVEEFARVVGLRVEDWE